MCQAHLAYHMHKSGRKTPIIVWCITFGIWKINFVYHISSRPHIEEPHGSCSVPGVIGTGGCSWCTSALAAANFSQSILSAILYHEWFEVVGLDNHENVKTFVGIWHFVCQLIKTFVTKAVTQSDVCRRWRHTITPSECSTH